jgi:hypothetical protein
MQAEGPTGTQNLITIDREAVMDAMEEAIAAGVLSSDKTPEEILGRTPPQEKSTAPKGRKVGRDGGKEDKVQGK